MAASYLRIAAVLAYSATAIAQQSAPVPASIPSAHLPVPGSPDNPELLYSFFLFHDNFTEWLAQRKQQSPASSEQLDRAAADRFQVTVDNLPRIATISHQVVQDLTALRAEFDAAQARARHTAADPDPVALWLFQSRRHAVLLAGANHLRASLPASGWKALSDYITKTHQSSIRQVASKAAH